MIEVIKVALYGKQVQSDAINDAIVQFIEDNTQVLCRAKSSQDFGNMVTLLTARDELTKGEMMSLALVLGSEHYQVMRTNKGATLDFEVDAKTGKVRYEIYGNNVKDFRQEAQVEDNFMPKPDGYKEEPIQPVDSVPAVVSTNKDYVRKLMSLMKPYMKKSNPTLEDYCLEAPTILKILKREGKL